MAPYYADKLHTLRDLFDTNNVKIEDDGVRVEDHLYRIVDDVIVLDQGPPEAPEIQRTFGAEWQSFPDILPEHEREFDAYFDLVDVDALANSRACDLGCGIGRWSYFLAPRCRELLLVDFSDSIFVARRNLARFDNVLFFRGDLTRLPFKNGYADFVFSLGVLHHLPIPALSAVRALRDAAPQCLVYLYYALDNRPLYFRALLAPVTAARRGLSRIRGRRLRAGLTWTIAVGVYMPLVGLGSLLSRWGAGDRVPLYDSYAGKSLHRVRQDVYDRFFTGIEQRVTHAEIERLRDTFSEVAISPRWPYWHFVCRA
jgi:SAM-dependent methyltransferase